MVYIIYANIGGILMVNVTIYSIHGSYEGINHFGQFTIGSSCFLCLQENPR